MIRRPPRSTRVRSSAASDVYKRQGSAGRGLGVPLRPVWLFRARSGRRARGNVSYTHLRAHETPEHLVCRLLLEKKKTLDNNIFFFFFFFKKTRQQRKLTGEGSSAA